MIAKVIAWDATRAGALDRLAAALDATEIVGLVTNRDLLRAILRHEAFRRGEVDTGFIARHRDALLPPPATAPDSVLALAAVHILLEREAEAAAAPDRASPWAQARGWRLNDDAFHVVRFRDERGDRAFIAHFRPWGVVVDLPGGGRSEIAARLAGDGMMEATVDGHRTRLRILGHGGERIAFIAGEAWRLVPVDLLAEAGAHAVEDGKVVAPMPGKVVAVKVAAGEAVKRGQALVVLEAMKMEHTLAAPADGTVASVRYAVGEQVAEGEELVTFAAAETPP
jgi:3-methylcrotonyl-CoA carboxylase alpha subunit